MTKTKAMRARLLGADDYTAISEYESVTDFIAFLREQPAYAPVFERHGEVAHRGQVEAVIRDSLYMDYCKLYRFSGVQPRRLKSGDGGKQCAGADTGGDRNGI